MSGIGRGRGWLNMNKTTRPGLTETIEATSTNDDIYTTAQINPKYTNIILKISVYIENDDGTMTKNKKKNIIKEFTNECDNAEDVKEACLAIHDMCLNDEDYATKAIGVLTARDFEKIAVHGVRVGFEFIRFFQNDFEGSKELQTNNPTAFRNTVKMIGDFYHKIRLVSDLSYKFLITPIATFLEMLLDSNNEMDFQLFTVQLYINGNVIKEKKPSDLTKILIKIRTVLSTNEHISQNSKLWLLMALDIANCRFNIIPSELHQFYLEKLGEVALARIRKHTTELSISTRYLNASLDSVQSNVNVLQQVSSSSDGWEAPSSTISTETSESQPPASKPHRDNSLNNIGTWEQPKNEKTPRPILGAGARAKHEPKNNESDSWRDRKPETDKKNNWDNKKSKQKKGWEHDDRFENDY